MSSPGHTKPWLVSRAFDLTWFVAPGLLAVVLSLVVVTIWPRNDGESLLLWVGAVLLVDVAHVYASLYRTYLDPEARRIHRKKLLFIPVAVLWFGALVHLASPRAFWTLLAYLAVFHFIKQHEGFAALYLRAGGEPRSQRRPTALAIWATTLGPVLWWHSQLPRTFAWFTPDDFLRGMPMSVGRVALWLQVPALLWFSWCRLRARREGRRNPMLVAMVLLPALTWNLGIVWLNDDRAFTLTNVLTHGLPYLALVWVAGGRANVEARVDADRRRPVLVALVFYGLLALLAFGEEALWDRWVWHEHAQLFGTSTVDLDGLFLALAVALLTVPQATHYVLDRFIWRAGPDNPRLARQLGLERA